MTLVLVTSERMRKVVDLMRAADLEVKRVVEILPPMDTGDPEEVLWIDIHGRWQATELVDDRITKTRYGW